MRFRQAVIPAFDQGDFDVVAGQALGQGERRLPGHVAIRHALDQQEAGVPRRSTAAPYAGLGDTENTLHCLEQMYEEHDDLLPWSIRYPLFDPVRSDARYVELTRRMNLEP